MTRTINPPRTIKPRFLIISDTHGIEFPPESNPPPRADVAIHCSDLTDSSTLKEYQASIRLLRTIKAPLKLIIAGNHDWTLDPCIFSLKTAEKIRRFDPAEVKAAFGEYGDARRLIDESADLTFLDEGNYEFVLANGAMLRVFASPYTLSLGGDWGFSYTPTPSQNHTFPIPQGTDVVITHGPPLGLFDMTHDRRRAGCPELFAAVERARPRLHCFGHIHEGWGAKLVAWRDRQPTSSSSTSSATSSSNEEEPSLFTHIDNERSCPIDGLPSSSKTPKRHPTTSIPAGKKKEKKENAAQQATAPPPTMQTHSCLAKKRSL
ncbi:MAG: hypothetical protein L6R37_007444 [Teloschistes peruensis]|nr:MAG: hypothetical protein L6R37_007444 [Teloschistes peruensis]